MSFIAINSMKVNKKEYSAKCANPVNVPDSYNVVPPHAVSSGLIAELIQCLERKPMKFHCQVSSDLMQ